MKYRNFDPTSNQPINAVDLLEKISTLTSTENHTVDLVELLTKKTHERTKALPTPKDKDLTVNLLGKYSKIADLINRKSVKRRKTSGIDKQSVKVSTQIAEFDNYLESKYPMAKTRTKEKFTKLLNDRIRYLLEEEKSGD